MEHAQVPCTTQPTSKGATASPSGRVTSFFLYPMLSTPGLPGFGMLWLSCLPSTKVLIGLFASLPECQVLRCHAVLGFRWASQYSVRSTRIRVNNVRSGRRTLDFQKGTRGRSNFICLSGIVGRQARALSI